MNIRGFRKLSVLLFLLSLISPHACTATPLKPLPLPLPRKQGPSWTPPPLHALERRRGSGCRTGSDSTSTALTCHLQHPDGCPPPHRLNSACRLNRPGPLVNRPEQPLTPPQRSKMTSPLPHVTLIWVKCVQNVAKFV
jgi:hypothetical protein